MFTYLQTGIVIGKREIPFFIPKDDCVHEINGVEITFVNAIPEEDSLLRRDLFAL